MIDNEIKDWLGVLVMDDIGFSKRKTLKLGFETYVTVLKTNDIKTMFLIMIIRVDVDISSQWQNLISFFKLARQKC